jgi:signal transduction histidine kinase
MRLKNLRCFALLLLAVTPLFAFADDRNKYSVIQFNDENGLPQNSIKGIARDLSGFIWLATESGLVRFDGQRFFTFDKSILPISSNRIYGFIPTPEVSEQASGFSALTENHEHVRITSAGIPVISKNLADMFRANYPVRIKWSYGLDIMLSHPSYLFAGYPMHAPYFFKGTAGRYYMWLNNGVETYSGKRLVATARVILKEFFMIKGLPIGRLPDGRFVQIGGTSVDTLNLEGEKMLNKPQSRSHSQLFWDCVSNSAFLYCEKNLYSLDVSADGKSLAAKLILSGFDFESRNIQCVYYDGKGTVLLGSHTQGLFMIREKPFHVLVSRSTGFENVFYAQMPPVFGNDSMKGSPYDPPALVRELTKNFVATNPDGTFWMAKGSSVMKFARDAKRIISKVDFNWQVKALYSDPFKNLWVASISDTLFVADNTLSNPFFRVAGKGAFGEITCLARLSSRQLLFGTNKGLFLLAIDTGTVSGFKTFAGMQIRSLLRSGGHVWVTTYGDGIYRISGSKITRLPLDKEQYLATSHCILEDNGGYFWITTNKGLFKALKADMENYRGNGDEILYLYYDKKDGFNTNEFNGGCQPCGVKDAYGHIYFPSMDGVVHFNPASVRSELPENAVYVGHFRVDGKFALPDKALRLPRSFKEIEISLSSPYFGNNNNLNLFYSFHQADLPPVWSRVPADLMIRKPNLGPGSYSLQVKKLDGFGSRQSINALMTVVVNPAWHETVWFKILLAGIILAAFWAILVKRSAYLVNEQKRKNIYRQYHLSSKIVAAISHDIQTPLQYVSRRLNQIQVSPETNQVIDAELIDTIERTRTHTINLLQYIKSQSRSGSKKVNVQLVDISAIIADSLKLLSGMAAFREITVENEVRDPIFIRSDPYLTTIIIHNALDNSIKFSESAVNINLHKTATEALLTIRNAGAGISKSTIDWLNKDFKNYDAWMLEFDYPEEIGLGLLIIKDLCILMNIKIKASSSTGAGTWLTFHFQLH